MNKTAILVLGPESSGTRLATRICLAAGCEGSAGHEQTFDTKPPQDQPFIVWRRSFPHAKEWPKVYPMVIHLRTNGYTIKAIVTVREIGAMISSQLRAPHVKSAAQARGNISGAYLRIRMALRSSGTRSVMLPYESLILHPSPTIHNLLKYLDLPSFPPDRYPEILDGNKKHYANIP